MKTGKLIDWAIVAFCAVIGCAVARAEETPKFICLDAGYLVDFDGKTCNGRLIPVAGKQEPVRLITENPATKQWLENITIGEPYAVRLMPNIRKVYHEKFEYIDGKLRILKPMEIDCVAPCVAHSRLPVAGKPHVTLWANAKPEPQAEGDQPKTICGTNIKDHTENITLLQVSCVDYDALRKVAPDVPWPAGTRTQVLVHVREGYGVEVDFGDGYRYTRLTPHQDGQPHGMVQFEGTGYTALPEIKVLAVK